MDQHIFHGGPWDGDPIGYQTGEIVYVSGDGGYYKKVDSGYLWQPGKLIPRGGKYEV